MQELVQNQKIIDDERKQVILEILADKYCKQILHNTLEKPKSAMEISRRKTRFQSAPCIEDYKHFMTQNYLQFQDPLIKMGKNTFYIKVR